MLPPGASIANLAITMNVGLKFDVFPEDDGYLTLRISAWNGSFGGKATVYVDAKQLKETAIQLRGFPVSRRIFVSFLSENLVPSVPEVLQACGSIVSMDAATPGYMQRSNQTTIGPEKRNP
jgi:hypothetical protein